MPERNPAAEWCCRHRWTLAYITVVLTLLLIMSIYELLGWA